MNNSEDLFYQQENHFWSAICLDTVYIERHTVAYFSELSLPIFNLIYLHQGANITSFEKAEHLFKQQAKPYVLVVHEQVLRQFEPQVTQRGLIADGESTAMVLSQKTLSQYNAAPQLEANYQIKLSNGQLADWAQPLVTAFPVDAEEEEESTVIDEYIRYHQRALDKQTCMMHFVLYFEKKPVSTLTLTLNNKTARLDDIGTDIQFQGKGLATQLIKHALYICNQHGIENCVLEASSDGLSIYKKLGFDTIFNYHSFIAK